MGRNRRKLDTDLRQICQRDAKVKRRARRAVHNKLTWAGFREHFAKPENGGLSDVQINGKWAELEKTPPADHKGVINGVSGCKRYRVKVRSESVSESGADQERVEVRGSKAAKTLKDKDVADFMAGPGMA